MRQVVRFVFRPGHSLFALILFAGVVAPMIQDHLLLGLGAAALLGIIDGILQELLGS